MSQVIFQRCELSRSTSSYHFTQYYVYQWILTGSLKSNAQKMKLSIKDFFSKCDQMRNFLRIWSHLLKKSLIEILIFCELIMSTTMLFYLYCELLTLLQCLQAGICFLGPNDRGCLCIMKTKLNIQRSYNSWPIVTVVEGKWVKNFQHKNLLYENMRKIRLEHEKLMVLGTPSQNTF